METTSKEVIEETVIVQVKNKVTTTDENVVIVLPKNIFKVRIDKGDTPAYYKRFLVIEYQDKWIDRVMLTYLVEQTINNYLGNGFIKPCTNCGFGYISLHYDDCSTKQVCVKQDEENYTIFTKSVTVKIEKEYKKLF